MLMFLLGFYSYTPLQVEFQHMFLLLGLALLPLQIWATFRAWPELTWVRAASYISVHGILLQLVLWSGLYLFTT